MPDAITIAMFVSTIRIICSIYKGFTMKSFLAVLMCLFVATSFSYAQGKKEAAKDMKEAKKDMKDAKKEAKDAAKDMKEAKKEGDKAAAKEAKKEMKEAKADAKEAKKDMKDAKKDMKDAKDKVVGKTADGKDIYEGPKGGRYTLSATGKKNYLPKDAK